ncbi:MAG TPA: cyclopropane-fatty-acyl-phospholipid synthase family protein [Candidatus Sulfotelmatobacter sp.]|nr:cyclopropane-fatty-acyl-phospholipid synthase family protein [Candidatus Sulfotelmatobacter sp.]
MVRSSLSALDRLLLQRLRKAIGEAQIRIVVGDTEGIAGPAGKQVATVVIPDRQTLAGLVLNPEVAFGEAYSQGRIRIEGDLVRVLEALLRPIRSAADKSWCSKLTSRWFERVQANTLKGSANNIHRHYDLTADFYRLWLDSRLVYTCAYFPNESTPLEQAQLAKMDYVCRKVQLRPGDSVVEAGCGWGTLALHIAKHYGARVRAFNISREQIRLARERAKQEGLTSRVEFIEDDYRNISGQYDVFLSVGMLEHVGRENYQELGRVVHRSIGDSGRGLLHFIGRNQPHAFSPWIRKRIFPGAYVPALAEAVRIFEPWDFSVFDVENMRWHYAKTLEHWLARFEHATKHIADMYGDEFVRAWRLYLAGSLASFRVGALQLFQVVFAGANYRHIPWTRAHLYPDESRPAAADKWIHAAS